MQGCSAEGGLDVTALVAMGNQVRFFEALILDKATMQQSCEKLLCARSLICVLR
jgi:hypothetical protein